MWLHLLQGTASKYILLSLHLLQEMPEDVPAALHSWLLDTFNKGRKNQG